MSPAITRQDFDHLVDLVKSGFKAIDERFVGVDKSFVSINDRFISIDERFNKIEKRWDLEFMKIRADIFDLSVQMRKTNERLDNVDGRLQGVENDIKEIYGAVEFS